MADLEKMFDIFDIEIFITILGDGFGHEGDCLDKEGARFVYFSDPIYKAYQERKAKGSLYIEEPPPWLWKLRDKLEKGRQQYLLEDAKGFVALGAWCGLSEQACRMVGAMNRPQFAEYVLHGFLCGADCKTIGRILHDQSLTSKEKQEELRHIPYKGDYMVFPWNAGKKEPIIMRKEGEILTGGGKRLRAAPPWEIYGLNPPLLWEK